MDITRKKLLFLSCHRGTKENDLLLGKFAQIHLSSLSSSQLEEFEEILQLPDSELFEWISGKSPLPPVYANSILFSLLKDYYQTLFKND
jgi:antitoxin CptB